MTPRALARMRYVAALFLVVGSSVSLLGCDPRAAFYFLQPFEPMVAPPGPSLENKKIVVLTHATSGSQVEFPSLERDLNREFITNLKKHSKKLTVVDADKVRTWVEGHPKWTDPADAARDFEADVVVFLELEQFQVQAPGDLNVLQGSSKIHIQAFELTPPKNSKGKPIKDQPKESNSIYDDYQESSFPTQGPIAMDSGVGRSAFKNKFLQVVASEASWHFVEHSPEEVIRDIHLNQR